MQHLESNLGVNDTRVTDSTLPPPIERLNEDIMGLIFLNNADMFNPLECDDRGRDLYVDIGPKNDYALDITLAASQVCQSWRALLLQSPATWGRVLNLDRLLTFNKDGQKEILRRTGTAPLCFVGSMLESERPAAESVVLILQKSWTRIQRLYLHISVDASQLAESLLDLFFLDAPVMERFSVTFGTDATPKLVSFLTRSVGVSWLGQLRIFEFTSRYIQTGDILKAIKHMPRLQFLRLGNLGSKHDLHSVEAESIHLPHLVDVRLTCSLSASLEVARSIKPAKHCGIMLYPSSDFLDRVTDEEVSAAVAVIERYAKMFLSSPGTFAMRVSHKWDHEPHFSICHTEHLVPWIRNDVHQTFPTFAFRSPPTSRMWTKIDISRYMAPLFKLDMTNVHTFILNMRPDNILPFVQSLTEVVQLKISDNNLTFLNDNQVDATKVFFPKLKHLYLNVTYRASMARQALQAYFSHRKVANVRPIEALYLGKDPEGDYTFLNKEDGLKVTWRTCDNELSEYICGSGDGELLDFLEMPSDGDNDYDSYGLGSD
ncbi:hypothetical protein CVT26_015315 [Gymnopilus dilepis]|uniref:F-box domain-containing protein n=1 Tax=Gymnopilus dilepis TaxID=231916 RepID=A0A409W4A6_9AGAR|nr:hypothetical protein CVT26_015315 [Gymnopilus dilepis]